MMSNKRNGGSVHRSPDENTATEILDILSYLNGLFMGRRGLMNRHSPNGIARRNV